MHGMRVSPWTWSHSRVLAPDQETLSTLTSAGEAPSGSPEASVPGSDFRFGCVRRAGGWADTHSLACQRACTLHPPGD